MRFTANAFLILLFAASLYLAQPLPTPSALQAKFHRGHYLAIRSGVRVNCGSTPCPAVR